jgi:light-regulated signal transduction histidine kinase (bacteriophytochrome)
LISLNAKRVETLLAEDRGLLRTLIDNVPDLIFIKDTQSRFLTCNLAMRGFSGILLEDYAAQLPPQAQHYLHEVQAGAREMEQLIGDLLTFSRLSRQPLEKQPLSPVQLVGQALAELSAEQKNRQVEISIGELPACQADPKLLRQVWINLLANALKFTRGRQPARIKVGCQFTPQGQPVYFVKDNGVGFDMRYAHKLFGVFQRLHSTEEFEGTGAGLAIAQRIVQRHGGRIWAEGQVNQGATFFFTL